jgi:hypothetical protein
MKSTVLSATAILRVFAPNLKYGVTYSTSVYSVRLFSLFGKKEQKGCSAHVPKY